jgi:hypothetical protein
MEFTLEPDEIKKIEEKLEEDLARELRYDMKVALVPLPDGGYNILTFNRRPRTDVRGLCDPSFVAFNIASFTAGSHWKSRGLQIWIKPYEEGWYLSTAGSREAMRQGRAHSPLGWLGVVAVPAFRRWLEKSFKPLPQVPLKIEDEGSVPMAGSDGGMPMASGPSVKVAVPAGTPIEQEAPVAVLPTPPLGATPAPPTVRQAPAPPQDSQLNQAATVRAVPQPAPLVAKPVPAILTVQQAQRPKDSVPVPNVVFTLRGVDHPPVSKGDVRSLERTDPPAHGAPGSPSQKENPVNRPIPGTHVRHRNPKVSTEGDAGDVSPDVPADEENGREPERPQAPPGKWSDPFE